MKKALIVLAAVALVAWVVSWFRTPQAVATSGSHPWPANLGGLDTAAKRYPPHPANAACASLTKLAGALPKNEAVGGYVAHEIARGTLEIGHPPALPDVSAIRELLLHQPVVWPRGEGIGGDNTTSSTRAMQMTLARALVANALAKARANDPAAWEDLHAVWNLARSLDDQPQMMTRTAALSMLRITNAVAWKLPLPAPPWFSELQSRDAVQPLVESFHYAAASYWDDGARIFPTKFLANDVEHDRAIAEQVVRTTTCDVHMPENKLGVDLSNVWRRAFRYRAERDGTANAIRIREGKPVDPTSRCTDGTWTFDGTTLRFPRDIRMPPQDGGMPLVLRVKP